MGLANDADRIVIPSATWPTLRATISAFEGIVVYVWTVTKSYTYASTGYANPDAVTQIGNGLSTTTYAYDNNGNVIDEAG